MAVTTRISQQPRGSVVTSTFIKTLFTLNLFCLVVIQSQNAPPVRCSKGWPDDGRGQVHDIPAEWIDDGYCDCPLDGSDEPNTEACSGSMDGGWAGISAQKSVRYFQCPQQQSLRLPLSRLNDGICDCCEGADEPPSSCPDECDEVLAEERAAREKARAEFVKGYDRRQKDIESFQILRKETISKIDLLTNVDIPALQGEIDAVDRQIKDLKLQYMNERLRIAQEIARSVGYQNEQSESDLTGFFEPLSLDELETFIQYTCQLSGEMDDANNKSVSSSKNSQTCVPLRLAGIDMGFLWEDESIKDATASFRRVLEEDDPVKKYDIADLMDSNSDAGSKYSIGVDDRVPEHVWADSEEEEDLHDDNYYEMEDDDYYHDEEDDGDYDHERVKNRRRENRDRYRRRNSKARRHETRNNEELETKGDILRAEVESTELFLSRTPFLTRASEVIRSVDALMKDSESGEDETSQDEEEAPSSQTNIDPMAIQMVSGNLSRRQKNIRRGVDYAVSARILLGALKEAGRADTEKVRNDMIGLSVGTLYHGKIGLGDLAEIIYMILPEFRTERNEDAEQGSCQLYMDFMCPPRTVTRKIRSGSVSSFPPSPISTAAGVRCKERSEITGVCAAEGEGEIPGSVPDGYFNYYLVQPRDGNDILTAAFEKWDQLPSVRSQTSELEVTKSDLEKKLSEIKDKTRELDESIGGRKEMKFGADGELHSLRETCHSVEAGKYVYELCMFDKATQRDRGAKSGGTGLGRWKGISWDGETGDMIMTWENGLKCWNGPQRSATVYVTCGAETEVLTADEPDTCRYVLTMKSHVACNEAFGKRHGLL